jgi:hypothetical protein
MRLCRSRSLITLDAQEATMAEATTSKLSPEEVAVFQAFKRVVNAGLGPALALNETAPNRTKYLDLDVWFQRTLIDVKKVGLHLSPPLCILDIGTGPGYFPCLCREFGHDCIGLDRPGMNFFRALRAAIGVEAIEHRILPFRPLPSFKHRFHWVTAFRTPFNRVKHEKRLFSIEEWSFFLDDLRDNILIRGGGFFIRMNDPEMYEYDGPSFGTKTLMQLFKLRGGAVLDERHRIVRFAPLL